MTAPPSISELTRIVEVKNKPEESLPATDKQRAYLKYLGATSIPVLKKEASEAISAEIKKEENRGRVHFWQWDKLHRHPDLWEDLIEKKKPERATALWVATKTGYLVPGIRPLPRMKMEEVREVVEYLDKERPGWDLYFWGPHGVRPRTYEAMFIPAAVTKFESRLKVGAHPSFQSKIIPAKPPVLGDILPSEEEEGAKRSRRVVPIVVIAVLAVLIVSLVIVRPEWFGVAPAIKGQSKALPSGETVVLQTAPPALQVQEKGDGGGGGEALPLDTKDKETTATTAMPAPGPVAVEVPATPAALASTPAQVARPETGMMEVPAPPPAPAPVVATPEPAPVVPLPSVPPVQEMPKEPVDGFHNLVSLDGRTIRAKVILVTPESVLVEREDFVKFDIPMDKLSPESAELVRRVFRETRNGKPGSR